MKMFYVQPKSAADAHTARKLSPPLKRTTVRGRTRTNRRGRRVSQKVAAPGHDRGRRRTSGGLPKYHTIKAVAEALDVSVRTVRRWIANGHLIVHRVDGVVRVAEGDLWAFLASHRDG